MNSISTSAPVSTTSTPNRSRKFLTKTSNRYVMRLDLFHRGHLNHKNSASTDNCLISVSSGSRKPKTVSNCNKSGNFISTPNNNSINSAKNGNSLLSNATKSTNYPRERPYYYLCCTGCCSFACMSGNTSSESPCKPQVSSDLSSRLEYIVNEEKLTVEQVQKWAESFDYMIQSKAGQRIFREYLKSEYSEENILFYLACEELKNERSSEIVEEKARYIYEDYISILSPNEVSLDSRVREIINENMIEPNAYTFDEAQLQIYTLMHRDSYPRFLNSKLYKDLYVILHNSS